MESKFSQYVEIFIFLIGSKINNERGSNYCKIILKKYWYNEREIIAGYGE